MLNIPESIKTLFKTDGVRKNFRAHFPNGELADITNDNIVRESLHFTESICSQNTFRFGLSEASVLEFETVGVGNMYGMTIEASIEIDTTSLTAAQISAIQAGTWDGTLVLAADSDIGFGFFRVPLGVFRVESCPRNHGAMAHRQVTAYSYLISTIANMKSEFERGKEALWRNDNAQEIDAYTMLVSRIGYANPQYMADHFTKEILFSQDNMSTRTVENLPGEFVDHYHLRLTITEMSAPYLSWPHPAINELWQINAGDFDYQGALQFIQSAVAEYGSEIDYIQNPVGLFSERIAARSETNNRTRIDPFGYGANTNGVAVYSDQTVVYPYNDYLATGSGQLIPGGVGVVFPIYAKIELLYQNNVIDSFESTATIMPTVYKYIANETKPILRLRCEPVASGQTSDKTFWYRFDYFSDKYMEILSSTAEVFGSFAKEKRTAGIDYFILNNTSPTQIPRSSYEGCWWDEYDVSPIGTVSITYKGEDAEVTYNIQIGSGASLYDMKDNTVLMNIVTSDINEILDLILGDFATNSASAAFTPAELNMQGWPWLEAGDALQITAEDGTVVNTYALRVEMSGIQNLTATITAEGGEIIGEA